MNEKEFVEAVKARIEEIFPKEKLCGAEIKFTEVVKHNDRVLHGVCVIMPEYLSAPTYYIEDFYENYQRGRSIDEVVGMIFSLVLNSHKYEPMIGDMKFDYESIKDKLIIDVMDKNLNEERLKKVVNKPLKADFVMVPYIICDEGDFGLYRLAITQEMAEAEGYNIDILMERAFANTKEMGKPYFASLEEVFEEGDKHKKNCNPLELTFAVDMSADSYVLTREGCMFGAYVLFIPGVMKSIGRALMCDYYVVPSSIHEFIIYPEREGLTEYALKKILLDANRNLVIPSDVLSNSVFKYSRENNELIKVA